MSISFIKNKKITYLSVVIVVVIITALQLRSNKKKADEKVYKYDKQAAIYVKADTIKLQAINDEVTFSGIFEPDRESKLSAETQGKVNAIYVSLGQIVSKGQLLIKLDDAILRQQLQTANIQLTNIQNDVSVQLQTNQLQIDALEVDVRRYKILVNADAIQGTQLEKAELQLESLKKQRISLLNNSQWKNAAAQRDNIIAQINKTSIYAPFDGIITAQFTELGTFAAPGISLLQITDINRLKFTILVSENDIEKFALNYNYPISLDYDPDIHLMGKAILIGSKTNSGNAFPVQFIVNNTGNYSIKSGMFGKIKIHNPSKRMGIIIPSSTVVGNEKEPKVYIIKDGKAIQQKITIQGKQAHQLIIKDGLNENDVIVTSGLINLFDSANVIIN